MSPICFWDWLTQKNHKIIELTAKEIWSFFKRQRKLWQISPFHSHLPKKFKQMFNWTQKNERSKSNKTTRRTKQFQLILTAQTCHKEKPPETSTFRNTKHQRSKTFPHLEVGPYIDESHVVTTFHATTQMCTNLGWEQVPRRCARKGVGRSDPKRKEKGLLSWRIASWDIKW